MSTVRVYRLAIEYPEGSREDRWPEDNWHPQGWEPADYQITSGPDAGSWERTEFRWPAERAFLSRSGARQRKKLLEGYGAKVTILPSLPVEWPAGTDGE